MKFIVKLNSTLPIYVKKLQYKADIVRIKLLNLIILEVKCHIEYSE